MERPFFFSRASIFYNVDGDVVRATRRFLWVVARCGTACLLCARFALGSVQGDPEATARRTNDGETCAELRCSESESLSLSR